MHRQTFDDDEEPHPVDAPHLLEEELASRWRISLRTLQRRRLAGRAPAHLKIGRRVLYPREAVEQYEARFLQREGEA